MLIFIEGNDDILKNKFLKQLQSKNVEIINFVTNFDKMFRILRFVKDEDKIFIVNNSPESDRNTLNLKFNNLQIQKNDLDLFEKYYNYYKTKLELTENNIKYLYLKKENFKINIELIDFYIKKMSTYSGAKWLTGC